MKHLFLKTSRMQSLFVGKLKRVVTRASGGAGEYLRVHGDCWNR
jgi:hypothetical protein